MQGRDILCLKPLGGGGVLGALPPCSWTTHMVVKGAKAMWTALGEKVQAGASQDASLFFGEMTAELK